MARDPGWTKIRYAYVHGSMSYRELAENYNVSLRTLSEVAKKEKWVTKRLQFRDRVNARADARACKAEADQLERIRIAADKLGGKLEEIMRDEVFFSICLMVRYIGKPSLGLCHKSAKT